MMVLRWKRMEIHWKIRLRRVVPKNQYRGGGEGGRDFLKRWVWTVCGFKGLARKSEGWCFWGGGVDISMHTMLYVYIYFLNKKVSKVSFLFLIKKMCSSLFHFFNQSKTRIGDQKLSVELLCNSSVINTDEWVYLLVSCPNLILVSRFKSNWWAQQGFRSWLNYEALGNLLIELVILLW